MKKLCIFLVLFIAGCDVEPPQLHKNPCACNLVSQRVSRFSAAHKSIITSTKKVLHVSGECKEFSKQMYKYSRRIHDREGY